MRQYVAGVDIGNATTETALGLIENGQLKRCVSDINSTTGIKGTNDNTKDIIKSLKDAAKKMGIEIEDIDLIRINEAFEKDMDITGAILKKDDGILVNNKISKVIPILDEVEAIDRIPIGMPAAVEVSQPRACIEFLSNPYGIATVFGLTASETKQIVHIAKALIGNRSTVVTKTPAREVKERRIQTLSESLANAVGLQLLGIILDLAGFDGSLTLQNETALLWTNMCFTIIPAAFTLISAFMIFKYPVTGKMFNGIPKVG